MTGKEKELLSDAIDLLENFTYADDDKELRLMIEEVVDYLKQIREGQGES